MRPIATDLNDFPKLRETDKIYVDKTMFIHRLVTNQDAALYFMSRPRRFGKSLTVSTLKALFQGRRELFKGLAIDSLEWKWQVNPIIHFRFNELRTDSLESFDADFTRYVLKQLRLAGHECDEKASCTQNFADAIEQLHAKSKAEHAADPDGKGEGVVILIDEYDAPVGHSLHDLDRAEAIRERMAALYSQMKDRTACIRFLFMTGVSKFTKLSVFSALSNIVDISQDSAYATMLGYTEDELTDNFDEHLRDHAEKMGKPYDEYRAELKRWYNGFRFSPDVDVTVYNPISVAYTLRTKSNGFKATWATTGRPSMLMNYLKREEVLALDPNRIEDVDAAGFDVAELRHLSPIALLYQSGYLTIKDYDDITESYTLGVPDEEVRRDLCTLLAGMSANNTMAWASSLGKKMLGGKWDAVFDGLQALYAGMAYGSTERRVHENSYGRCLSFLLASQGFDYTMENVQSNGRADVVAKHPAEVCIFELKVDEPVDKAFAQIREKGYAEPFRADSRPVWLIGLSFDSKTRHLVDFAVEKA